MKVINATFSKIYGGAEAVFVTYSQMLKSQGNSVISVVHPRAKIKSYIATEDTIAIRNFSRHDPFTRRALKQLIDSVRPDCIITHNHRTAYLFKQTKLDVPIIAVAHAVGRYDFDADAIIAVSEHMRQDMIQKGYAPEAVVTVPNAFNSAASPSIRFDKFRNPPIIGVCSRFVASKGIDVFIHALAILKQRGIVFHAKIAGEGRQRRNYLKLIKHYQLQSLLQGWGYQI